jgi:hypothetical protein
VRIEYGLDEGQILSCTFLSTVQFQSLNCIVHTILFLIFIKMNSQEDLTSPSLVDSPREGIWIRFRL